MAKAGRKSKYKRIYEKKRVDEYLLTCEDKEVKKIIQENKEKKYAMYKSVLKITLPSVEGYAAFIGFSKKTLYNWGKLYPEFAKTLERIMSIQKQKLIENGLQGTYNAVITRLLLSSNHGMKEKSDVTTDDKPINTTSFTDEQINRIADRIARRESGDVNTSIKE